MEYKILVDDDRDDLADAVRELCLNGWTVQGGVSMSVIDQNENGFAHVYAQAMVREGIDD